ncbi:reverse transcriptase [Gossypium australe]|uniref:Reverse transcriptase n=1 Tax=Gossypium australe TaxID=47621 RepID=A0A5B6V0Z7_9ROSI|nr:reverse transcriptase [Gossypium australe]
MLFIGRKEVIIKAIMQAIPIYAMSYFLLPSSLCNELEVVIARKKLERLSCIGALRNLYMFQRMKAIWIFETYQILTLHY